LLSQVNALAVGAAALFPQANGRGAASRRPSPTTGLLADPAQPRSHRLELPSGFDPAAATGRRGA